MYRRIEDFLRNWEYEAESTKKVLASLTDATLKQAVSNDHRTLGRIAWHIITTIPEMMGRTGLKITEVAADSPMPKSAAEFKKAYGDVSKSLQDLVTGTWQDDTLKVFDDMYGEQWQRGASLRILISHEIHHRAQMTVLMRQAGLPVPGVYGPSLEEWSGYGAKPPEI